MKEQGIGGFEIYQCDSGILPVAVFGPSMPYWSPAWAEQVRFAVAFLEQF
jgi:hypothetical protein